MIHIQGNGNLANHVVKVLTLPQMVIHILEDFSMLLNMVMAKRRSLTETNMKDGMKMESQKGRDRITGEMVACFRVFSITMQVILRMDLDMVMVNGNHVLRNLAMNMMAIMSMIKRVAREFSNGLQERSIRVISLTIADRDTEKCNELIPNY